MPGQIAAPVAAAGASIYGCAISLGIIGLSFSFRPAAVEAILLGGLFGAFDEVH